MSVAKIKIFDTTMRDGEQSPGCSMNLQEKVELAKMLEKLNVDVMEAGFAIASKGDFKGIQAVARAVKTPIVCSLSRAIKKDLDVAWEAICEAQRPLIHTFIATSPIHMEKKLHLAPDKVVEQAAEAVRYAKAKDSRVRVEFSAEDASRSDREFLVRIFTEVIKAGADVINVPDTVGYAVPGEFGALIKYLKEHIVNIDKAAISVHCHNDLGLAVANSLAAVQNGATQCEATINGIGERAGNCSMEELVMALKVRKDHFGEQLQTGIKPEYIYPASRLLTSITGVSVQQNKAIVGANAFAHEAGIHQDGVLKCRETYEIMRAEDIGRQANKMVLGKHSGRHAFVDHLHKLGYLDLKDRELDSAFEKFKELADKKKEISDFDLVALLSNEVKQLKRHYRLNSLQVEAGSKVKPKALLELIAGDELISCSKEGNGPVDAIFQAIDELIKKDALGIELLDYVVHAVTEGTDALGEVTVRIKKGQQIFTGHGANTDVLIASAAAYLEAVNKFLEQV